MSKAPPPSGTRPNLHDNVPPGGLLCLLHPLHHLHMHHHEVWGNRRWGGFLVWWGTKMTFPSKYNLEILRFSCETEVPESDSTAVTCHLKIDYSRDIFCHLDKLQLKWSRTNESNPISTTGRSGWRSWERRENGSTASLSWPCWQSTTSWTPSSTLSFQPGNFAQE